MNRHPVKAVRRCTAALAALTLAVPTLQAQTFSSPSGAGAYFGINLGRSNYDTSCGVIVTSCDQAKIAGRIYGGTMFSPYFGLEAGYVNMGDADRAGGRTQAQGVNLSAVGRLPLGASGFSLLGRAGTTYSETSVSAGPEALIDTGKRRGWGPAFGAGMGVDLSAQSTVVLEWERHRMDFVGSGEQNVDLWTVGYRHRF